MSADAIIKKKRMKRDKLHMNRLITKHFRKKEVYGLARKVWGLCRFLLIFGLGFVILYPLLQIMSKVFMPTEQYQDLSVIWIPKSLTLSNVVNALKYMNFWKALSNTLILC